jgi:hypothetical protein
MDREAFRIKIKNMTREERGKLVLELLEKRGTPRIVLPADENGHAFIDKEKHPDLYEWAVEG